MKRNLPLPPPLRGRSASEASRVGGDAPSATPHPAHVASLHAPPSPTRGEGERIDPEQIIAEARTWIGTPYRHQASCKGVGCDCLGFLRGVWREVVGTEPELPPPYSADWAEASRAETLAEAARRHLTEIPLDALAPGDILLFRWRAHLPAKHCAILVSDKRMIHAHDGAAVTEVYFANWWRRRLAYAFRFSGLN